MRSGFIKDTGEDADYAQHALQRAGFVDAVIPKDAVGAELGVFKGHFSRVLFEVARPKTMHLIDPWYFGKPFWPWAKGDASTVHALVNVLCHFERAIHEEVVQVHVGDDCEVLERFPDGYLDWAYIDTSHAYEHTCRELEILSRKVKPTGVIAGDDWVTDPANRHHGVYRAVNEFVQASGWEFLVEGVNRQWAITGPGFEAKAQSS